MKMKRIKMFAAISLMLAVVLVLSACSAAGKTPAGSTTATASAASSSQSSDGSALDLTKLSLDEITAGAKKEGDIESAGMPDYWANWAASWTGITDKYGITHADVDMGSAEELALFESEKDDPTKDIGDVGIMFAVTGKDQGLLQPYKVSNWDAIPDWAKDADGYWTASYTGTTCFIINDSQTNGVVPTTWKDLMDSDIVVCPGDVVGGASAQLNVVACAIAMGGSEDNLQPGIDYFIALAKAGRLDPGAGGYSRLQAGEVECTVDQLDFNGVSYAQSINAQNIDGIHITPSIPQDGALTMGYAEIINKYAPHPQAAACAMEYFLSDQGQIDRAYGGARPIRSDVTLPDDVPLLDESLYKNAKTMQDAQQLQKICNQVATMWQEQVMPLMGN
jgi:putative spermidine/putrescine transport system substrate-binding protein